MLLSKHDDQLTNAGSAAGCVWYTIHADECEDDGAWEVCCGVFLLASVVVKAETMETGTTGIY